MRVQIQNQSISRHVINVATSAVSVVISISDPSVVLTSVEVVRNPPSSKIGPLAPAQIAMTLAGISTSVSILEPTPLIWRYKDVDIELGNRFPYAAEDTTDSVADFEVCGKVVKSFLGKNPMYNQNLNVKATVEDVGRIKAIVLAAHNCEADRPLFEWPFEVNKEGVFKFVNKDNLKVDFAEIFDATEMKDIYDLDERRCHPLEAQEVRLGSRVMVEFTVAIWKKKPGRAGCTFHLISVGVLERGRENFSGGFRSPKRGKGPGSRGQKRKSLVN